MLDNIFTLLLSKLPGFLKGPIFRNLVSFPLELPENIRFKVAETEDELTQAFKLLHDSYVSENLMQPHPSGMRITKYHALPSTTTLIALENNVVVGTVSLIRQSTFGVPSKSIFNLEHLPAGSRFAEVSALAIRKDFLTRRNFILFPLFKFLYHFSTEYFGISQFVIATHPSTIDFYQSVLGFEPLSKKFVPHYSFVNQAPAAGAFLNLILAPQVYFKLYGRKPLLKNGHHFFTQLEPKNMEFPLRKKSLISDPILSPELFKHFFVSASDCLRSMSETELFVLREMYDHPEYLKVIPDVQVVNLRRKRLQKRFETVLQARLQLPENRSAQVVIQDVSLQGLGGFTHPKNIDRNLRQKLLVNIEDATPCELEGHFIRVKPTGQFGFIISKSCSRWTQFVEDMDSRMMLALDEKSNTQKKLKA